MRFAIDVVTLDREARVLEIHHNFRPWRVLAPKPKPHAILELPAQTAKVIRGTALGLPGGFSLPLPEETPSVFAV
jgi:uncharacterized membrane protein (UPF0127 family)